MRLYHDYKRLFSYILIGIMLVMPAVFLHADVTADLSTKINQRNSDINALEQEIAQYQTQLDGIGKQKNSLNGSIKQLDLTRKKLGADILLTQKKIEKTNLTIESLSSQINVKEDSISNNTTAIEAGIKNINEFESINLVNTILSNQSFTNGWNDVDNIVSIREKIQEQTKELKQVKGQLEGTRKETLDAKKELLALNKELADQKKIVDQNTAEKKKLLAQTKNSEATYQKLLADKIAKKNAFENELRDYESQLKFILDPASLPKAGVLSWPLDNIYITQFFGKTEAGKRLYVNGTHNGVDFRASVGTPVMAMADGVVMGTGNTDLTCPGASFGKFVFIEYNNGLASTYGHFSLIGVSTGQKVTRGQVVGYSGNTGYSTGPHLHVSVYAGASVKMESRPSQACDGHIYTMPIAPINGYLDPMFYLPLYKS